MTAITRPSLLWKAFLVVVVSVPAFTQIRFLFHVSNPPDGNAMIVGELQTGIVRKQQTTESQPNSTTLARAKRQRQRRRQWKSVEYQLRSLRNFHSMSQQDFSQSENQNKSNEEDLPPYVREHCDLTGVDQWMVPENDWRRRTPAFLILGEKKSGTTGLFQTLNTHPQVVPGVRKELIFFNPKRFKHWSDGVIGGRVKVAQARAALFSHFPINKMRENSSLITGEGTPEYLLYPDICDKAILCTVPWVKVLVIIREPVERLFSHYNFLKDPTKHNREMPSFERFVNSDIRDLTRAGVLPANVSDTEAHMGSQDERDAHLRYQFAHGERQFLRSLYALHLEGWTKALRRFGKDPKKDMRVVVSNQVKTNPNVSNELFEWLGLPRRDDHQPKRAMITKYTSVPIDPKFKAKLNQILAPYNKRLYRFLGPDYEGIFDKN